MSEPVWSATNVTGAASGAPPLSGSLFVSATPTQISIDGQAANWGDLFSLTSSPGSATWSATDVSATGGTRAHRRRRGHRIQVGTTLTLYAAGVNSPPPQGVGVYAIPSAKWTQAITDGWPIVSETGGLGTQSAPWVGFTGRRSVANSPDFLMGQSIYNSHKRVTWLSFWTVSGPLKGQPMTTTNYYNHGFAAGAWVATQIDQYRSLGVGLKPDWVIFDPEGYPDNHSGLDAPGGSSAATLAKYATYWSAMLKGWASGIASVDPSLNAGRLRLSVRVPQLQPRHPVDAGLRRGRLRQRRPDADRRRDGIEHPRLHLLRRRLHAERDAGLRGGNAPQPTVVRSVQHLAVQRRRVLPASLAVVWANERHRRTTTDAEHATKESGDSSDAFGEKVQDLRNRLKQLTQPFVDSLDSRLRDQIDRRVDDRVDDRVQTLVDEALAARLSVIERAIADIDRALKELQAKLPRASSRRATARRGVRGPDEWPSASSKRRARASPR